MARLLIAALQMKGHELTIASRLRSWDDKGNALQQDCIRQHGQALARRYVEHHKRHPPDVWFTYHLYHKAPDWIGPNVANAFEIPYIVAEASFAPKQSGGAWAQGHQSVSEALMRADCAISLSPTDIECVVPALRQPELLKTIAPFLNTEQPSRAAARRHQHRLELARKHRINTEIPWLLTVAMMREGDKFESYSILSKLIRHLGDSKWELIIVGDGPARAKVEAMLGTDAHIHYLGMQSPTQIMQLNAAADVFCWPAINEAYGMAMLEAQAAGLPVVAGFGAGVAQIVDNGKTGALGQANDPRALADMVRKLLNSTQLRKEMRNAALEKTAKIHNISTAATQLDKFIREAHIETNR
jgi:glycosyltransferase involved in cell wall biosynthesis